MATPRASLVTPAIQAVFGAFYLGVAQGALATAREYTRTTSRPWLLSDSPSAAADPYVLATYGRLVAATRAVEALADAVADHLDRFWRNVRTHTLHDPVAYKRREVGDHYLNGTYPPFTLYT